MSKMTIKKLQTELADLKVRFESRSKQLGEAISLKEMAKESESEAREQFDDLKKRLHKSEMEVARLNGYLARVREDDIVREDLVTVGEPGGEQRMVPKRKPEFLGQREEPHSIHDMMSEGGYGRERKKPKHWIEY